jgi:hypothetical protein
MPKYFIYYFVYPNQWSLGDIFAKYSRMLLILALLPWQLSGPAYSPIRDLKIDVYGKRQTASEVFDFTTLL